MHFISPTSIFILLGASTFSPLSFGADLSEEERRAQDDACPWSDPTTLLSDALFLRTKTDVLNNEVTLELTYEGPDDQWVGVGLSEFGAMIGSTAVIGVPVPAMVLRSSTFTDETNNSNQSPTTSYYDGTPSPTAAPMVMLPTEPIVDIYALNGKEPSAVRPVVPSAKPSGTPTYTSLEQTDTRTVLTYTQPLDKVFGDADAALGGLTITANQEHNVIWAIGGVANLDINTTRGTDWASSGLSRTVDIFLTTHSARGGAAVVFRDCRAPDTVAPTTTPPADFKDLFNADGLRVETATLQDGAVEFEFQVDAVDAQVMTVTMTYAGRGWIGFAPSPNGRMIGTTAILGLPDEPLSALNPGKYDMDSKSPAGVRRVEDDQSRLALFDTSLVQNDTHTVMTVSMPLGATSNEEVSIDGEGENTFIFAYGRANALAQHAASGRGSFGVNFSAEGGNINPVLGDDGPPNKGIWAAHGTLMALSWGVFVPLAIASSLLRRVISPNSGRWFTIHKVLNGSAFAGTIIALCLAIYAIADETAEGESANHFSLNRHRKVGLVICIGVTLQILSGIFRPHGPSQPEPDETEKNDFDGKAMDAENEATHQQDDSLAPEKSSMRRFFEIQHRVLGSILLALALYNCHTGLFQYESRFTSDVVMIFWAIVGTLLAILFLASAIGKFTVKRS